MPRKKWRTVYRGSNDIDEFHSEGKTYEWVDGLRTAWAAGGPTGSLTVQVDDGFGWQPHEHIDFAEEGR